MKPIEEYYRSLAMAEFLSLYKQQGKPSGQRMGQYFVNNWIIGPWDFLYYQEDDSMSKLMIVQWLHRYGYHSTMPPMIRK